ncbi:MAG: hypothetical protein ABFR82_05990 [Nitrospirota bacterium]
MVSPIKKITSFRVKLIADDIVYSGIVETLSENELYIRAASKDSTPDLIPGKTLKVNFHSDSGKEICLFCKIQWSYKTPPYGITDSLGMKIIGTPSYYEEFFETL